MRLLALPTFVLATAVLAGCGRFAPERAASVGTGYLAHQLCAAVFVGGREPDAYFRTAIEPLAGPLSPAMRYSVDRQRGEVRATLAGMAPSVAVYRPPYGCVLAGRDAPVDASAGASAGAAIPGEPAARPRPWLPEIAGDAPVVPDAPGLAAALDHAFEETPTPPHRNTEAVVVVHAGRVVAERYAPGIGIDTRLTGWSATKSVVNALVGILVLQGRLDVHAPAPIAAWADPADPRHAITVEQLMRMTSGLDMGQSLSASVATVFDPSAQMIFVDRDTAATAEAARLAQAPGTHWNYSNANTQLLSRIVRDQAGGSAAATLDFVQRELFDKLGMRHATLEFDAAGTPIGASHLWASARDWARFGQLYLHDGVVGGRRMLPPGWVDFSAAMTPGSEAFGYGAGFWTERGGGAGADYRVSRGMPPDSFMARGTNGQYVVIVPSHDLVIVRLGPAWTPRDDMDRVARLTRETIEALGESRS